MGDELAALGLISLQEAAALSGRQPVSLRRAASIGRLEAVRISDVWVTSRDAVGAYMALMAAKEWESIPQRHPAANARRRKKKKRA